MRSSTPLPKCQFHSTVSTRFEHNLVADRIQMTRNLATEQLARYGIIRTATTVKCRSQNAVIIHSLKSSKTKDSAQTDMEHEMLSISPLVHKPQCY